MEIIGLSGYARSGKDEAANILVKEYGFERVAFADKLRDFLYAMNPRVSDAKSGVVVRVQDVIDVYGWDKYKETEYGAEIRYMLQRLGTEAGRQVMWDTIWIDAAFAGCTGEKIVVTDVRFPNEADAVRGRGGEVWRVSRVGVGPAVGEHGEIHASETSLDNYTFDAVLFNDGSLATYQDTVRSTYESRIASRV